MSGSWPRGRKKPTGVCGGSENRGRSNPGPGAGGPLGFGNGRVSLLQDFKRRTGRRSWERGSIVAVWDFSTGDSARRGEPDRQQENWPSARRTGLSARRTWPSGGL